MNGHIKTADGGHFHRTGDANKKKRIFSVNEGIDIEDALQSASNLLSTVDDSIHAAGMGEEPLDGNNAWLVLHTIESAKAILDAVLAGLVVARESAGRDQK
jgi:hypothetical protein